MSESAEGSSKTGMRKTSISGDRTRELIKPPQKGISISGTVSKVAAILGLTIGAGAVEATAHPVQTTAENITSAVVQNAENIKNAGENLVDFYNEDPAIRQKGEEIAGKLNGTIPLSEGEQIFERVEIVPAGATFEERQKMEQEKTPINVRKYPGTVTPDGRFSSIIGTLPQGTIIEHVISIKGGVPHPSTVNDTGDWLGFIYRKPNTDPNQPGEIGFAYGIYGTAQAVGEAASSTPAPSEPPTNQ